MNTITDEPTTLCNEIRIIAGIKKVLIINVTLNGN